MAVQPGTSLGPYEIQSPLGAGGRGPALELAERSPATANSYENAPVGRFPRGSEVYKARDSRLDRTVAVKVLPSMSPLIPREPVVDNLMHLDVLVPEPEPTWRLFAPSGSHSLKFQPARKTPGRSPSKSH